MAVSQLRTSGRARPRERREGPAFADDLLAMAGSLASSRKDYASAQLETLAESFRLFGDGLPAMPTVKAYAESAADGLDELASYVLDSELPDILSDAREFARRYPLATFGCSVVAGLLLTQLVQARTETMRSALRSGRQRASATARQKTTDAADDAAQ